MSNARIMSNASNGTHSVWNNCKELRHMILDGHIHIWNSSLEGPLKDQLTQTGIDGGVIISRPPQSFGPPEFLPAAPAEERMDCLLAQCAGGEALYPFYWIDPTEDDAVSQVSMAADRGALGFKVICSHHYPGDPRAMKTYAAISEADKPILFHSGILWDGTPSSQYNRPVGFECLLEVPNLRFALAHISWPWCDELIAVYGKFQHNEQGIEMFVDTTRGTPDIYRRDAMTKLYTVGYKTMGEHVFFGTDSNTDNYREKTNVQKHVNDDREILTDLGLKPQELDAYFAGNLKRFLGLR